MESKDLKTTLLLPRTNFPIKEKKETQKQIVVSWEEKQVYKQSLSLNAKRGKKFVVHDGPPYANGSIHVGHLVNRILKDFVVRFHNLVGYQTFFKLGWDTHGLPIEFKVISSKNKVPEEKVRELCREYANEQIEIQRSQLKELALFTNYKDNYSTGDNSYEATQLSVLAQIVEKKLIYRGLRPVYWSWSQQTALAENEVEYRDREDFSLFFKLELAEPFFTSNHVKLLIWTTQPWTIVGNMFVGVKPDNNYLLLNVEGEFLICSEEYLEKIAGKEVQILRIFRGESLLGLRYLPLYPGKGCFIIIDAGNLVKTEEGTGLLHLAPACGREDFLIARHRGVEIGGFVDEKGFFSKENPIAELVGIFYQEANQWILNDLEKRALISNWGRLVHSYPHDWRDKSPLIYLLTSQWFIDLTKIRQNLLTNIEKVEWVPAHSREKMLAFIRDRDDWCISRQRRWGVPIPAIYNKEEITLDPEVVRYVAELVAEEGSDFWFQERGLNLIRNKFAPKFGEDLTLGTDTLDVWFDSGVSSFCVLDREANWPAHIYLEGSDQFRGWFNSSLILSSIIRSSPPYRKVISHGFVVDEKGRKMSKSLGNTVEPLVLIERFGINTLRWWVASVDFTKEMKVSNQILLSVQESYQKLRNCLRFIIASLYEENSGEEVTTQSFSDSHGDVGYVNDYIKGCLVNLTVESRNSYLGYNFVSIYNLVNDFCVNKLSTFYFEIIKDILYCDPKYSKRRKVVLQNLNEILKKILIIIIPLLPSLAEEIYQTICDDKNNFAFKDDQFYSHESVNFIYEEGEYLDGPQSTVEVKNFENSVLSMRKNVFRELEKARQSGVIETNQQAVVTLFMTEDRNFSYAKLLVNSEKSLSLLFIVSEVNIKRANEFSIEIKKTSLLKCERCWRFTVYHSDKEPFCPRCIESIS